MDPTTPRVMHRSYSVKSSGSVNGPAPKVPWSRGRRPLDRLRRHRRHAPVGRGDDERGVTERPDAPLVAEDRFLIDGAIARAGVAGRPARELLGRQRLTFPERFGALRRHAAHVVAGPDALQIRMAPRGFRRRPPAGLLRRRRRLGGHLARLCDCAAGQRRCQSNDADRSGGSKSHGHHLIGSTRSAVRATGSVPCACRGARSVCPALLPSCPSCPSRPSCPSCPPLFRSRARRIVSAMELPRLAAPLLTLRGICVRLAGRLPRLNAPVTDGDTKQRRRSRHC